MTAPMPDAPAPARMALLEAAQSVLIAFAEGVEWTDDQRSAYVALDKAVKDTRPAPATPAAAAERVARADLAKLAEMDTALLEWALDGLRPSKRITGQNDDYCDRFDALERVVNALPGLLARVAELEGALEPWVRVARINAPLSADWPDDKPAWSCIPTGWPTWGDLKRASEAYGGELP